MCECECECVSVSVLLPSAVSIMLERLCPRLMPRTTGAVSPPREPRSSCVELVTSGGTLLRISPGGGGGGEDHKAARQSTTSFQPFSLRQSRCSSTVITEQMTALNVTVSNTSLLHCHWCIGTNIYIYIYMRHLLQHLNRTLTTQLLFLNLISLQQTQILF